MLVDVARDCEVPAGGISLNVETVDGLATPDRCFCGSEDVQAVATGTDLDVVAWDCLKESRRYLVRLAVDEAVVEIDSADAVAEHEAHAGADVGCFRF